MMVSETLNDANNKQSQDNIHPLENMPSFEEHMQQMTHLPRTSAVESVVDANGDEVHPEPTDLSLKSTEKLPLIYTEEDNALQFSETKEKLDLFATKDRIKSIMNSTFESRINNIISLENPEFYQKVLEAKNALYYDSEENRPSEDEIEKILVATLPVLEQYDSIYQTAQENALKQARSNRIQKSEEKKIYNFLHKDENDRLKNRRSLYTAYDLSNSKSIPDEYAGLSFEEVRKIEQEKQSVQMKQNIFDTEEGKGESEPQDADTEKFYEELSISEEEEPHFREAIEIYNMLNWQAFPNNVEVIAPDESNELAKKVEHDVVELQFFGAHAKENPPNEFGSRNVGADDRLLLGDKYNSLISNYQKVAERRAITTTQSKRFCHELSLIINKYEDCKDIWKIEGEKSLGDALDSYSDIYGKDAVLDELGAEIPEQVDRYTIMPIVTKINSIVRQDWKQKITPIESYDESADYSLICSRVKEPFAAKENRNSIFSGSLLTKNHHETIGDDGNFGFVLSPDHIIAAAPYDLYTNNWSDDDESSLRIGIPVVMSYDRVLQESQANKTYSEITTRELPIGIFYIKEKINDDGRRKLEELIKMNPNLPIIAL